jgi:poly-gamma-glutamate synthesis protein (capsule biosynthesis protein)
MPYGRDCTKSLLAKAVVSKKGVERVSFLPMKIDKRYRPEPLKSADPRFGEIRDYLEWASQGFEHQFSVDGDEVVVS